MHSCRLRKWELLIFKPICRCAYCMAALALPRLGPDLMHQESTLSVACDFYQLQHCWCINRISEKI